MFTPMTEIESNQTSFSRLLDRLRAGDDDAVRELIECYGDALRREIRFWLRDSRLHRVVGESDLFQSAIFRFNLGLQLGKFVVTTPDELLGLLRTIAQRRVCSTARFWQARRRDVRRDTRLEDAQETTLISSDPTPSRTISEKELIAETLARLPERDRQVVQWRQDDLGWAEIAARLPGTATPEAVRKQYERALARVAAGLGLEEDGQ
jgi:RNA polymerase sigma factor (sigma-70 family)